MALLKRNDVSRSLVKQVRRNAQRIRQDEVDCYIHGVHNLSLRRISKLSVNITGIC